MREGDIILFYHTARASVPSAADEDCLHLRLAKGFRTVKYLTAKYAVLTDSVKTHNV